MHTTTAIGYERNLPTTSAESLVEREIEVPALGPHDLLVEVRAVSVNPVDVKLRAGAPSGGFRVLGFDAAGTVRDVGSAVTLFAAGDDVYYAGSIDRPGTNQSLHVVDERIVGPKPASLTFAEAAAMPLTTITAWEALFDKLRLTAESTGTLLVLGASGGVGSMVVQLAKALTGVRVIATASRPESRAWVESLGADVVVDHSSPDLEQQILDAAPGGVDAVFTPQSRGRIPLFVAVTRPFGEIVAIDDESDLDFLALKSKALTWHWEFMFARPTTGWDLAAQHDLLRRVAALVDEGTIRTALTRTFAPFDAEQLRRAHAEVEGGRVIGKVVVARDA